MDGSIDGVSDEDLLGLSLGNVDGSIVGASEGISLDPLMRLLKVFYWDYYWDYH